MKKTGRPVSPHVTIYSFPIAALSSITNRVMGSAMAVGAFGLGGIELVGGSGASLALMETIGSSGFLISSGAKFCVSFPIVYHYGAALRHFAWDYFPEYLENADVEKASYALLGGVTVVTAGIMLV
jgi:succinate dehydrogenase (ubiquinone) cytochrome b560 subunit